MGALGRLPVDCCSSNVTEALGVSSNMSSRNALSRVSLPGAQTRSPSRVAVARAVPGKAGEGFQEADDVLAEFIRHVESTRQPWPLEGRQPTALMPPTTVVRVVMDALMRNDWPEDNSGIRTAFSFAMPPVHEMLAGEVGKSGQLARAWYAAEKYLSFTEFAEVIQGDTYSPMLDFTNWEAVSHESWLEHPLSRDYLLLGIVASPLTFHGPGDKRAVQAVKTTMQSGEGKDLSFTFTFCLEKVLHGVYRGCWLVVGVRVGDYANV